MLISLRSAPKSREKRFSAALQNRLSWRNDWATGSGSPSTSNKIIQKGLAFSHRQSAVKFAKVTDEGIQKLPPGNGSAQRAVVKYPSDGGYAPVRNAARVIVKPHLAPRLANH